MPQSIIEWEAVTRSQFLFARGGPQPFERVRAAGDTSIERRGSR